MAKLVARPLATAALGIRIESRHHLKIVSERHKLKSGQHTIARKKYTKNIQKKLILYKERRVT
jgi:hypothetical protein